MKIALVLGLPNSTVAAVCPRCTAPWPSAVRITGLPHGRLSHHVGEKADGDFFSTTGKRSSENKEAGKVRDHLQRQLGAPVQQWRPSGLRSSECHLWPGPLSLWGVQWRQKQHQRRYGPIGPRLSFSWCCWTIRSRPSGVDPTQLRWSIRGDPLLNIQWRKGFVSLLGGTAGTLAQQPGQFIKAPGPRRTLRMRRIKHLWRRRRRRSRRLPTAAERPPGCHRLHALPARGEMSRFRQRESRPGVHPAAEIGLFLVHQLAEILQ